MKKRHLTPDEIKEQCKRIALESRMAEISPWSAMGIMCGYILFKAEGFKAGRIVRVCNKIDEYEQAFWDNAEVYETQKKRLMDKADWTIENREYTEKDIKAKKGTYRYWIDQRQLDPQNRMNAQATRYMTFMFVSLMDEYGYGKARLTRVQTEIMKLLDEYQENKTSVKLWQAELKEGTGIIYELPKDPLTQRSGSMMTGAI